MLVLVQQTVEDSSNQNVVNLDAIATIFVNLAQFVNETDVIISEVVSCCIQAGYMHATIYSMLYIAACMQKYNMNL